MVRGDDLAGDGDHPLPAVLGRTSRLAPRPANHALKLLQVFGAISHDGVPDHTSRLPLLRQPGQEHRELGSRFPPGGAEVTEAGTRLAISSNAGSCPYPPSVGRRHGAQCHAWLGTHEVADGQQPRTRGKTRQAPCLTCHSTPFVRHASQREVARNCSCRHRLPEPGWDTPLRRTAATRMRVSVPVARLPPSPVHSDDRGSMDSQFGAVSSRRRLREEAP